MSWSFSMEIDVGGAEPERLGLLDRSYTYNVGPMFEEAFDPEVHVGFYSAIRSLNGRTGAGCISFLERAIERMMADPEKYRAMNPSNGWGDYEGALELLQSLLGACERAPKARMVVT